MTQSSLKTSPSKNQIEEFKTNKSKMINVKGFVLRVKTTLQIESIWQVDYDREKIHFVASFLWTLYEKSPLSPMDIPDRHKRAVRRIGSTLFGKRRFDGLVLFEMSEPSVVYAVLVDGRPYLFAEIEDARLWLLCNGKEDEIRKHTKANEKMRNEGQRNSLWIRTEILGTMIQATRGIEATDRLRMILAKGCKPDELEAIWRDAHGVDNVPETLRSIIQAGKEKTKV